MTITSQQHQQRRYLSRRARNALLTAHIMISVGLLGDSAGFLAVAMRAANAADKGAMTEMVKVLSMFAWTFGVPLSFGALLSGIALGLGTRWGVLRYPWVMIKLLLIVTVILVGALVIRSALADALQHGGHGHGADGGCGGARMSELLPELLADIAAVVRSVLGDRHSVPVGAAALSSFRQGGAVDHVVSGPPRMVRRRRDLVRARFFLTYIAVQKGCFQLDSRSVLAHD